MFSFDSVFRPQGHIAGKVMDGELVAINLRSGLYYSSAGAGPAIWQLVEAGHTASAIADWLVKATGGEVTTIRNDVEAFVTRLLDADLVELVAEPATPPAAVDPDVPRPYLSPTLTSFDDMEQAFALDPPLRA